MNFTGSQYLKVFGLDIDLEGSQKDLDKVMVIPRLWGNG